MNTETAAVETQDTATPKAEPGDILPRQNPYQDRVYAFPAHILPRKLPIVLYPDPRLEKPSDPVEFFGSGLDQFAANLVATAIAADAAGLSAVQVGVNIRVVALRVSKAKEFVVLVNPTLDIDLSKMVEVDEGCLSFPGVKEKVQRSSVATVYYQDLKGEQQEMTLVVDDETTYVAAQAAQHEVEHLDGVLLTASLNFVHRDRVRAHMKKVHRKLDAIVKKTGGKFQVEQVLFGYIPDPEPKAETA
jgi:peptide deformylase